MHTTRLRYLLEKHIVNTISDSELEELAILLQKTDPQVQEDLLTDILENTTYGDDLKENRKQIIYDKIITHVLANKSNTDTSPTPRFQLVKRYASVAAMLLVGLSIGLWIWTTKQHDQPSGVDLAIADTHDIYLYADSLPSVSLPDGYTQVLADDQGGTLTDVGIRLIKEENGEVIYAIQQAMSRGGDQPKKMMFSTPKGHTNRILLADGTQVWLNSGSSLEYPEVFSATERRVKLVGEGYFDVAHNQAKPFYVETDKGPVIEVLGTSFNVSAYQEENVTTTTLVEGKVRLLGDNHTIVLNPMEQVTGRSNDRAWQKNIVDVDDFISWKDGYFRFTAYSVEDILAIVQRWYNIEHIEYKSRSKEKFTGTFKRTKSLKSLLVKLEKISDVKFDIIERRIVVSE